MFKIAQNNQPLQPVSETGSPIDVIEWEIDKVPRVLSSEAMGTSSVHGFAVEQTDPQLSYRRIKSGYCIRRFSVAEYSCVIPPDFIGSEPTALHQERTIGRVFATAYHMRLEALPRRKGAGLFVRSPFPAGSDSARTNLQFPKPCDRHEHRHRERQRPIGLLRPLQRFRCFRPCGPP